MKPTNSDIIITPFGNKKDKQYKYHVNYPFFPMTFFTTGMSIAEGKREFKKVYKEYTVKGCLIEYWRNPTEYELKFGEGAIHYKTFHRNYCRKPNGALSQWLICPDDGLRYYLCK